MTAALSPTAAIEQVMDAVGVLPAALAGSAPSAETYGLSLGQFSDIDVFTFTPEAMMVGAQRLLHAGGSIDDRHARVWHRWLTYGVSSWHTNSLKMHLGDLEVNFIYKSTNRHPLTSLSQVLESFDFGLLGTGYDLQTGKRHDLRSYLFPNYDIDGPLPLMPARRDAWRGGFISQYQGMRELGRYAKYAQRGYDLSLVKDDLIEGYLAAAAYLGGRPEDDKQLLAQIYTAAAGKIRVGDLFDLEEAAKQVVTLDTLDAIMEALE